MPDKIALISLDLEPDHAGLISETYSTWNKQAIRRMLGLLKQYSVPLSVFVVAQSLSKKPGIIDDLKTYNSEFHLHSYSHNLRQPDSENEIERGFIIFKKFFKSPPKGYRAPEGRITHAGLMRLQRFGFMFDASVFPSFWPRPWYFFYQRLPYKDRASGIIEIPFTTLSPLHLPMTLSFIKLLGWDFYKLAIESYGLPNIVLFGFHMHDIVMSKHASNLAPLWRWIYSHNRQNGLRFLERYILILKKRGYRFFRVSKIANQVATTPL